MPFGLTCRKQNLPRLWLFKSNLHKQCERHFQKKQIIWLQLLCEVLCEDLCKIVHTFAFSCQEKFFKTINPKGCLNYPLKEFICTYDN